MISSFLFWFYQKKPYIILNTFSAKKFKKLIFGAKKPKKNKALV